MTKFDEIDPQLLGEVVAAVAACWVEGSPVAGQSGDQWHRIAHLVIRRIRSFARRNISQVDRSAQIRDIARGLVAALEADPQLVGPLRVDYEYVAAQALDAVRRYEAPNRLIL